jgi:hypothetical protein
MRDDFTQVTKELLARRVGVKCSNPVCRQPTSGPQQDVNGAVNIGVAAHITAASPGGARYDATLSPEGRNSIENGIWLCQNCAKLIDNDTLAYSVEILKAWRQLAEATAKNELERGITIPVDNRFARVERDMPDLLAEMRTDLAAHPLSRRFTCVRKTWTVNTDALVYFYEAHPHLDDKIRVLEDVGLVREVTPLSLRPNRLRFYQITEPFADYLRIKPQ